MIEKPRGSIPVDKEEKIRGDGIPRLQKRLVTGPVA
jgi:hypothetical protein